MNIFVGNLSFEATENDIKGVFEGFGTVLSVKIKKKKGMNSRGFGFVNMPDEAQAQAAISGLQNKVFMGRPLSVSVERPKAIKPKKDYQEIKRKLRESKLEKTSDFVAPIIPEKRPLQRSREDVKKSSRPAGPQTWEKRKGRGTAKPWKKKPGGVNKKFKFAP